jgi:hypothetical protein
MELPPGCASSPFDANVTLGPLGIDYLHVHYCVLAGLPLLSGGLLLVWLVALFYFRASRFLLLVSHDGGSAAHQARVPCVCERVQWAARQTGTSRRRWRA